MRLFTFSGIEGSFIGSNEGHGLIQFARDLIQEASGQLISYNGLRGQDHFTSDINYSTLLSTVQGAVTLNGSPILNQEAWEKAPAYATAVTQALSAEDPAEPVIFLGHSQGTNLLTFTLKYMNDMTPGILQARPVRVALFDPKVGANYIEQLFVYYGSADMRFLFLQSDHDILGNQAIFATKFIDQFPHGNHWWIRGLDHSSIREWNSYTAERSFLTLEKYLQFRRDCRKELIHLQQEFGKPGLNTTFMLKFQDFQKNYPMPKANLRAPLISYLTTGRFSRNARAEKRFLS
jgi:hypothetical protein